MVMNVGGTPMNLTLYDQQGNVLVPGDDLVQEQDSEETVALNLVTNVRELLAEIDQTGTNLEVSDEVSVYDNPEGADDWCSIYYSIKLIGGINGFGLWSNYFQALSNILLKLEAEYADAWVMNLNTDNADDVFEVEVGLFLWASQQSM